VTAAQPSDFRWLLGNEGARWLARVAEDPRPLVAQADRLRRELSASRVHLVLEQVELRRRARDKFLAAERMFFTRVGLEQATDQFIAAYKAARFPAAAPVADLCCGIGGDLLGLAARGLAIGIDRDPVAVLLAEANARTLAAEGCQVEVRVAEVAPASVQEVSAWHIDPDRRPEGRRTTHLEWHEPGPVLIRQLLDAAGNAAVKLAPAAEPPDEWRESAEWEWISRDRECRQLVAWFGSLAQAPGRRRATLVGRDPARPGCLRTLVGDPAEPPVSQQIGRYVFDPDPAVLAARLLGPLAAQYGLGLLSRGVVYLTGDRAVEEPALACFEVTDVLPFDLKRLRQLLRSRNIGQLEIKKRIVRHTPEAIRRQLDLRGDASAVLLIAPIGSSTTAILGQRREVSRR